MTDHDRAQFAQHLAGVYALYRVECSPAVLEIWMRALMPYDLDAIVDALSRHAVNPDTGQFIPKPADVVRMIEGSTVDAAMGAWAKVERAVASVGTYASVVFDDPLIHRVIADMGGWSHIGQTKTGEWPFTGKEFCTRYRGFKVARARPPHPPVLVGLFDADNVQRGHAPQAPVFIGDRHRALAVLQAGTDAPLLEVHHTEVTT